MGDIFTTKFVHFVTTKFFLFYTKIFAFFCTKIITFFAPIFLDQNFFLTFFNVFTPILLTPKFLHFLHQFC